MKQKPTPKQPMRKQYGFLACSGYFIIIVALIYFDEWLVALKKKLEQKEKYLNRINAPWKVIYSKEMDTPFTEYDKNLYHQGLNQAEVLTLQSELLSKELKEQFNEIYKEGHKRIDEEKTKFSWNKWFKERIDKAINGLVEGGIKGAIFMGATYTFTHPEIIQEVVNIFANSFHFIFENPFLSLSLGGKK